MKITGHFAAPLSKSIISEYNKIIEINKQVDPSKRTEKVIEGTGGKVSVADVIAYQIGWGKRIIDWYEEGLKGKKPEMPGEGFTKWDYTGLALHFYNKYQYDSDAEQLQVFHNTVNKIVREIVEVEHKKGRLSQTGVWPWCSLKSGKEWPLSKWITVNTKSPYAKAAKLIKSVI